MGKIDTTALVKQERKDAFRDEVIKEVERTLQGRIDNNVLNDETDFLMGASAVLKVANMLIFGESEENSMSMMPPNWMFSAIRGESILPEKKDTSKLVMVTTSSSNGTKVTEIDDIEPTLDELQEMVGGYIEIVSLANGDQMIVNEEGKIKGLPINKKATELYVGEEMDDTCAGWDYDTINGNAVILRGNAKLS